MIRQVLKFAMTMFDDVADLVDLPIELLLSIQEFAAFRFLEGRFL